LGRVRGRGALIASPRAEYNPGMYKTTAEFVEDWNRESSISLRVMRALTDGSLQHKSDPEGNTLGKIAWHMVVMLGMTGAAVGLEVAAPPRGTEPPVSAAAIADAYQAAAKSFTDQALAKMQDGHLASEVTYFGRTILGSQALNSLVRHQVHHRGQMTMLMRQAGLVVPSVYGPSREESAALRARQKA
jgi:uncharacterized damage-inducible protein DinB